MTDAVHHEDLRDAFLLCRTLGHAWFEGSASDISQPERGAWLFVVSCERCTTRRVDTIATGTGELLARKYEHPDGYQIDETVTRSQLRAEWEQRRASRDKRRKAS